ITAFLKAIELKPDFAEGHMWMGQAREEQKRLPEAVEQYRAALALEPAYSLARFHLGRTLANMGRNRDAIPTLQPLLTSLRPDDSHLSTVMVLLGEAYRAIGDRTQARQLLEQAQIRVRTEGPPELMAEIEQELNQLSRR